MSEQIQIECPKCGMPITVHTSQMYVCSRCYTEFKFNLKTQTWEEQPFKRDRSVNVLYQQQF
jgi:uncharacterized Zn ribbon protein